MEIIRRGRLPEEVSHTVTCRECHSRIRFKVNEAELVGDQRDGNFWKIRCPVCGKDITKAAT